MMILSTRLAGIKSSLILFVKGSKVGIIAPFTAVFKYRSPIPLTVINPAEVLETPVTREMAELTLLSPVLRIVSDET